MWQYFAEKKPFEGHWQQNKKNTYKEISLIKATRKSSKLKIQLRKWKCSKIQKYLEHQFKFDFQDFGVKAQKIVSQQLKSEM